MIDLQKLKVLAGAATPGPWTAAYDPEMHRGLQHGVKSAVGLHVVDCFDNAGPLRIGQGRPNAAFMAAASPDTVLALVEEITTLEDRVSACNVTIDVQRHRTAELEADAVVLRAFSKAADERLAEQQGHLAEALSSQQGAGDVAATLDSMAGRAQQERAAAPQGTPFMYAIMGPDGAAHLDENCVSSTAEGLALELAALNDTADAGYSVAPVYLAAAPQQAAPANDDREMAGCMSMVRDELIQAGVIDASIAPMFVADAVVAAMQKAQQVAPAVAAEKCDGCNGHGLVGNILDTDTCPFCKGTGEQTAPAAVPAQPGMPAPAATVTLTGHQLVEALGYLNPDGAADPQQLEGYFDFGIRQHRDDDGVVSTGMCCWNDDDEGVMPLSEDFPDVAAAAPVAALDDARAQVVLHLIHNRQVLNWRADGDDEAFSSEAHELARMAHLLREADAAIAAKAAT